MKKTIAILLTLTAAAALFAGDHPVKNYLAKYEKEAGASLNAERGKELWEKKIPGPGFEKSCTGCHNTDPKKSGKHKVKGVEKEIKPMALSANKKRYTKWKKVDKSFDKFCKKVYDRACTAQEKGDMLLYLSQQ